jgi:hypothetical protein
MYVDVSMDALVGASSTGDVDRWIGEVVKMIDGFRRQFVLVPVLEFEFELGGIVAARAAVVVAAAVVAVVVVVVAGIASVCDTVAVELESVLGTRLERRYWVENLSGTKGKVVIAVAVGSTVEVKLPSGYCSLCL